MIYSLPADAKKELEKQLQQLTGLEAVVLALQGEGVYDDSEYAQRLSMRAILRVGAVKGPKDFRPSRHSPADAILHANLEVSRKRSERHLAPHSVYLKAGPALRARLRVYVDSYAAAGANFKRWAGENPKLLRMLNHDLRTMQPKLSLTDTGDATLDLDLESRKKDRPLANARQDAARLFGRLVTAAPTTIGRCPRCQRYFLNRTGRSNRKYCSRKCALHSTAIEATKRSRKRQREEKLERARLAIKSWSNQGARGQWKPWVASRAGVSLTFLTRATNQGALKVPARKVATNPPKKEKRNAK